MKKQWEKYGFFTMAGVCLLVLAITAVWRFTPALRGMEGPDTPGQAVDQPGEGVERLEDITPTPKPTQTPVPAQTPKPLPVLEWPVKGVVLRGFGLSYQPSTRDWRMHEGVDIQADSAALVNAALSGEVTFVGEDDLWGHKIILAHEDGFETEYSGLVGESLVKIGDAVLAGQRIGLVGEVPLERLDGTHVHFVVRHNGTAIDPLLLLPQA